MKSVNFLSLPLLAAIVSILIFSLSAQSVQASNLYLSSKSPDIKVGDNFQVDVKLNTQGEEINALAENLNYPADKLEVQSIDTMNAFPILADQTVDGNLIKLAQGSITPVNGDLTVATITFKAKSAGDVNLNFAPGSAAARFADSSDSLDLAQSQGSTLNIANSMNINEAGPSATPAATSAKNQTLSFKGIWNLVSNWFNS